MTRAKDISKIITDADFSGTLDVTGTVTANELSVDSVNINGATVAWQNSGANQTYLFTSGSSEQALILRLDNQNLSSTGYFEIQDGSAGRKLLNVDDNGDISFYEDTGTTPKLFWDASAESLGIGTSSPSNNLSVVDSSTTGIISLGDSSDSDYIRLVSQSSLGTAKLDTDGELFIDRAGNNLYFRKSGSTQMFINNSGNVGIGTSSPSQKLEVSGKGVFSTANPDVNGLKITATTGTNASAMQFTNAVNGYVGLDNSTGGRFGSDNYGLVMYQGSPYPITFHTNGIKRMKIDENGQVTMPYQSAFSVSKSSTQTNIAINSYVTVTFDTEIFDQNANFASNTFTAPVTGRYQLNGHFYMTNLDTAVGFYEFAIRTSNRNYTFDIDPNFSADVNYYHCTISVLADLDIGDTAYLTVYQQAGTQQTSISAASKFSGYLVA